MFTILDDSGNTSWTAEQGWKSIPAGRYAVYAEIPGTGTITLQWRRATGSTTVSVNKDGDALTITASACEDFIIVPEGEIRANAASVSGGNVSLHLVGIAEATHYR